MDLRSNAQRYKCSTIKEEMKDVENLSERRESWIGPAR